MYRTDAHALQAILRVVNDTESGKSLQARWQKALGIRGRTEVFMTAHGEVVRMLNETVEQIRALPESKRSNYDGSIPQWWMAVMAPDLGWSSAHNGPVIGVEHIALLGSLGDVIESRLDNTSAAPGGMNLTTVREQCDAWLVLLDETDLPSNLRDMLRQGIEHLLWLIKNADHFGLARIARTAEDLTGQLAVAQTRIPTAKQKATWSERMNQWGAGILLFNGLLLSANVGIDQSKDLIHSIEPGVAKVIDLVDGDEEAS